MSTRSSRALVLAVSFLVSGLCGCGGCGVSPRGIPSVDIPVPINLAEAVLDVARSARRGIPEMVLDEEVYPAGLQEHATACRQRIRGKAGCELVRTMNDYIFRKLGLRADPDEKRIEFLFPDAVLREKTGSCLAVSGLYLILAQELGLPFFGVLVPGHFFLRYDDGRVRVNVEMLEAGAPRSDGWYARRYQVPRRSECYLRSLSPREVTAPYLFNLGNACRSRGDLDQAAHCFEQAKTILPGFAEAHGNLGLVYLEKGEPERAVAELKAAVRANPSFPGAYLNLGAACQEMERFSDAVSAYARGLALTPHSPELRHALGTLYHRQGMLRKAAAWYRKALIVKPDFAGAHRDLASVLEAFGHHELAERHRGIVECRT